MRSGNQDIYGYELSTGTEFQITTNAGDQRHPKIACNYVVWHDRRDGDYNIYMAELDINKCAAMQFGTPENPPDYNSPMRSLASNRISQAQSLMDEVQTTCEKLKNENDPLYSKCCVDRLDEVAEYLEIAEKHFMSGNFIAANYWALKALEILQEIEECCM